MPPSAVRRRGRPGGRSRLSPPRQCQRDPADTVTTTREGSFLPGRPANVAHRRVVLLGLEIDNLAEQEVIDHIVARLQQRQGGRVATPNVDILRLTTVDEDVRRVVAGSDLVVADGVPLLWLARLARQPLRGRVSGANLIYSVSAVAARAGASIYLLGGPPGAAQRAGEELQQQYPGLRVVGTCCPGLGFESSPEALQPVVAEVAAARPDIVFCGLGFPKQERVAEALQSSLPAAWFIGCGAAIAFAAGDLPRAPQWMQRNGLEWLHRLAAEPKRLFRRYVIQDLPFFAVLLAWYLLRYVCPRRFPPCGFPAAQRKLVRQ